MKTLHRYLLGQVLASLLMTVAVFTFVLLLGNVLNEILALMVSGQATLGGLAGAIGLLVPFVLVFALPMGMLTAALLVFGRFSADQELTAVRASGISLVALITPILLLSLLLCGVSAWINMDVAPRCRVAYKQLIAQMSAKVTGAGLPEEVYDKDVPHYMFYIGRNDGKLLKNVTICHIDKNDSIDSKIDAESGEIVHTNGTVYVNLYNLISWDRMDSGSWRQGTNSFGQLELKPNESHALDDKPQVSDMTFRQLQEQLRELNRAFSLPHQANVKPADLHKELRQLNEMKKDVTTVVLVQMHRQVACAFACFGFTLVGIPLGIRAHRRETNIGIVMALILVLIYYSFMIIAQSLQTHPELTPYLIFWLPNFLFQIVGAAMLWRVNKGV
ncbi:MAG TPA: LptF/LptG family permease [Verrucomicrobiae bacterium]|nr:LptF/LptG family permease [Verrucomicrobiae bacterium]